jgi:hypothetical protein
MMALKSVGFWNNVCLLSQASRLTQASMVHGGDTFNGADDLIFGRVAHEDENCTTGNCTA